MDVNVDKEAEPNPLSTKSTTFQLATDEATKQKIIDIIDHQFDLEIYLKQKEIATIKQEIAKAEAALQDLKTAVDNEHLAINMPEQAHYTRRSAAYYHGGPQALYSHSRASTPPSIAQPRRKVYRTAEKSKLYGRRQDGTYVSLACPACHRDDFANQQGFLNHCRISHGLEFGPYEQMALQCGTPVDESEVPMDSPARLRPVMNFIPVAKKQKKLERPSIKVFEEDIDMDLENERKAAEAAEAAQVAESAEAIASAEATESAETTKSAKSTAGAATSSKLAEEEHNKETTPIIETPTSVPTTEPTTVKETNNEPSAVSSPVGTPISTPASSSVTTAAANENESKVEDNTDTTPATETDAAKPKIETVPASISATTSSNTDGEANTIESGSRFYVKRRIIIGNVSKFIPLERRDSSLKQFTHKWMIYIVEPPQSHPVSTFITCARFHLHPSYKPHDVIDVTAAPFKLTRLGWGEFPIRVQLFFVDKRRNKSVDIIHVLKLDDTHSGKQLLGGERSIEIELDRNTDFTDSSTVPSSPASAISATAAPQSKEAKATDTPGLAAVKQRTSLLGGILKECVKRYPIIRAGSDGSPLPYSCAISTKQFKKWPVGRRKATEWHRAKLLRVETQKRAIEAGDNVLRMAAEALTTRDVILWCKTNKYTPITSNLENTNTTASEEDDSLMHPLGFCKFCGSLREEHNDNSDDQCPQAPKGWNSKKRATAISSLTSVDLLLNTLEPGWDEQKDTENMDVDVDMDDGREPAFVGTHPNNDIEGISERVEKWALDAETMDIANERTLDWIWSVLGQLRLKSITANDMLFGKDGNLQGPTPNFDVTSAMVQRLTVGNIMAQATRVFLKRLIKKSTEICSEEEKESTDKSKKMLVPYHVYQATQQHEEFDFLTNEYMGSAENTTQITPAASKTSSSPIIDNKDKDKA